MGDGHHAWASAEIALALRNAFVMERWTLMHRHHSMNLLAGIPLDLFRAGKDFFIENAIVPEGKIGLRVNPAEEQTIIVIDYQKEGFVPEGSWFLSLPLEFDMVSIDGSMPIQFDSQQPRNIIPLPARSQRIVCWRRQDQG